MAQSYKVILWKTDGSEQEIIFDKKPAWEKIYPLINAELIQICKGFITGFSNRSFEMLTDDGLYCVGEKLAWIELVL